MAITKNKRAYVAARIRLIRFWIEEWGCVDEEDMAFLCENPDQVDQVDADQAARIRAGIADAYRGVTLSDLHWLAAYESRSEDAPRAPGAPPEWAEGAVVLPEWARSLKVPRGPRGEHLQEGACPQDPGAAVSGQAGAEGE